MEKTDGFRIHVLVIEDDEKWKKHIPSGIQAGSKRWGVQPKFEFAGSSDEAQRAVRCEHFHGISIDQNIPPHKGGGRVSPEEGMQLVEGLEAFDPPGYMAIYTAFPGTSYANRAGRPGIDYIVKSSQEGRNEEGNLQMDAAAHGEYFTDKVMESFIPRTLRLVEMSGFSELHGPARNAREGYEALANTGFVADDLAHDFFKAFAEFREHFTKAFAAFTLGLVSSTNSIQAPKSLNTAKAVDDWLKNTWDRAAEFDGQKANMEIIRRFLHMNEKESLHAQYLSASERLRPKRNDVIHNQFRFTADDFKMRRVDMFRVLDLAALLMRCKFAVQMYRTRKNYLTFQDINWTRARPSEILYSGNTPESKPNDVFALLPGLDRPIRMTRGLRAERDDTPSKDLKLVTHMT